MPTAISEANFQAAVGEAYDAIVADNYASAVKWVALAEAQLAGLLADEVTAEGVTVKLFNSLEAVRKAITAAEKRGTSFRHERHSRWVV